MKPTAVASLCWSCKMYVVLIIVSPFLTPPPPFRQLVRFVNNSFWCRHLVLGVVCVCGNSRRRCHTLKPSLCCCCGLRSDFVSSSSLFIYSVFLVFLGRLLRQMAKWVASTKMPSAQFGCAMPFLYEIKYLCAFECGKSHFRLSTGKIWHHISMVTTSCIACATVGVHE